MRFSFKKTLATILSIALILSSFVAAFSSSAAEASVVGALSLEDVSATLDDNNQFSAVANISLEQSSSYLHVAFTLADLPQGVSLVDVSADTLAATIVNLDNGIDAIYLEGDKAAVSNVAITFTFTADDDVDFTLAVNKIFAMDDSELDVNINVSDSAFVSVKKQQSGEPEKPCEHVWEIVEATPATNVDSVVEKGSISAVCTLCGATDESAAVDYYDNFRIAFTAGDFASEISLQFSARKDRLAEKGEYENVIIYFEQDLSDSGVTKKTSQHVSLSEDTVKGSSNRPCKSWLYGLKSLQMSEQVNAYVFVKANGVWYNGRVSTYSMRNYVDSRLVAADCTETEKILLVTALRYGSIMQTYKKYNTANLADAGLADEYVALIKTGEPTIADTIVDNHPADSVYINKYNLDLAERILSQVYFRADRYSGANKNDYTVVATWTTAKGLEKTYRYKLVADEENDVYAYGPEYDDNGDIRTDRYTFNFAGLNSYDLRQPVTFTIYDGETEVSGGYTASVEAWVNKGITGGNYKAELQTVFKAMLNYSDASKEHFCK